MTATTRRPRRRKIVLPDLAREVFETSVLFSDDSPFTGSIKAGDPRLLVVTGENAAGKSLLTRVMAAKLNKQQVTPVMVSIRERTGGGFRAGMMFGEEHRQSTGATSARVIATAIENNLDRPNGSVLILDEPELGLSPGYTRALGEYIGQQATTIPAACSGVVVVTHSRDLVHGLLAGHPRTPTHVSLGTPAGLNEWLGTVEVRTVEELLALRATEFERQQWAEAQFTHR